MLIRFVLMNRQEKLGKQLQRDLGEIVDSAAKQLLGSNVLVSVQEVVLTPDLGLAKVYLSFLGSKDKEADLNTLDEHSSTIRRYLAQMLKDHVRKVPEIQLYLDKTIEQAERINTLLDKLRDERSDN